MMISNDMGDPYNRGFRDGSLSMMDKFRTMASEFTRMQLAVVAADEMNQKLAACCKELESDVNRLEKQWEEHCAYHGSESPHALNDALYRASDAESHCKALAEDVKRLSDALAEAQERCRRCD